VTAPSSAPLRRRLGTVDAVVIGLGSMIGAGVFSALAPATAAAGRGVLIGLALAAVVAVCNALASAQLAAQYPTSGGSYVYGRERLGEWPGFFAGWSFVIGKTASGAAMALTVAAYTVPIPFQKPVAVLAVLALAAVNSVGITRTAALARVIVGLVLTVLVLVVVAGATGGVAAPATAGSPVGPYGVAQSAGLLFFAFAGYARVATLGEEVRDPTRTIPRAIVIALAITLAVYLAIAVTALTVVGPARLAGSSQPLVDLVEVSGWGWAAPVVRVGAAVAALGALLALLAGVSRTTLAMARNGDLPRWLAAVHPRFDVPQRAELVLAVVISLLIVSTDLRGAIGFSSFGVLLYYLVANASASTQTAEHRRYPRALQLVGALGCLLLVATLPLASIVAGIIVLAVGALYRAIRLRIGSRVGA
jgi:APA family basic amino acid/polyamine antiporter